MKKRVKSIFISLIVIAVATTAIFASACSSEQTVWDVSGSGTVTASLVSDGKYGFTIRLSGNGTVQDFASAKDAPWYGKSGRIKSVEIADGITRIGANAFAECAVTQAIVPQSLTSIGANAFGASVKIFAFGSIEYDGNIYVYSEQKPSTSNTHWRMVDGVPTVWDLFVKTTKVLFIGNSFTFYSDVPSLFGQIAASAGKSVVVESVTQGSWTLTKFADPTDEYGKKVEQKLTSSNDYDAIVLQEQSTRPLNNYDAFLAAAKKLQSRINETQSNCNIYLYATWGYQSEAASRNQTIPQMEASLRTAYQNAATEMNVLVCNVGKAFSEIYNLYPDMLNSDSADNKYNLYYSDKKHPSYTGAFLSACVHVATILNINPSHSTFVGTLDSSVATQLKNVAYSVVL